MWSYHNWAVVSEYSYWILDTTGILYQNIVISYHDIVLSTQSGIFSQVTLKIVWLSFSGGIGVSWPFSLHSMIPLMDSCTAGDVKKKCRKEWDELPTSSG